MKNILFITMALTIAVYAFGATKRIARVNEDGDTIFDRDAGFSPDVIEVEVSEVDGAIYVSMYHFNIGKFNENGFYDAGFELPMLDDSIGFDIGYSDYLWITGDEISSDYGLYKYTENGDYVDAAEDFKPVDSSYDFSENEVWACVDDPHDFAMPGVHKFSDSVSRIFHIPGYQPGYIDSDAITGAAWFIDAYLGLVKMTVNGTEEFVNHAIDHPLDPQASPIDGGCWFFDCYTGDLYKVDAFGSIVFHDGSFNDIAAIDVNESDGSVWVASNIPKRLVHLDKDGNRQLYKEWPGGDFAHLAVDQRNGTCIVIYEESAKSDLNIQPASVGEIKAMYAE
jgi:hypothetical protein